jgi:hypothetical protein
LTRTAVILHERIGNWARQLRPRLFDLPIRWFETRSTADLGLVLTGMACPVVLIDLALSPASGLRGLQTILDRASDARVLVLDAEVHEDAAGLVREMGATHVFSGFVPPPVVASLLRRWVKLASARVEHGGWSKPLVPDPESEPWGWLAPYLTDPATARLREADGVQRQKPPPGFESPPPTA